MVNWETIDLAFAGGVDTLSDEKLAPATKFNTLENATFSKRGGATKRSGYDLLPSLDGAVGIANRRGEIVGFTSTDMHSYIEGSGWVEKASVLPCTVDVKRHIYSSGDIKTVCYDEAANTGVYAWFDDSDDYVKYAVVDLSSNSVVRRGTASSATSFNGLGVVALESNIIIVWMQNDAGTWKLHRKTIRDQDPNDDIAEAVIVTTRNMAATGQYLRTCRFGSFCVILSKEATNSDPHLTVVDAFGGTSAVARSGIKSQYIFDGDATFDAYSVDHADLDVDPDTGKFALAVVDGSVEYCLVGGDLYSFDAAGSNPYPLSVTTKLSGVAAASAKVAAGITRSLIGGVNDYFIAVENTSSETVVVYGDIGTTTIASMSNMLLHTGGTCVGEDFFVCVRPTATEHNSLNLLRCVSSGGYSPAVTLFQAVAGSSMCQSSIIASSSEILFSGAEALVVRSDGVDSSGSVRLVTTDHQPRAVKVSLGVQPAVAEFGDTLYLCAGNLLQYDGENLVESGFLQYPAPSDMVFASTGSGAITLTNATTFSYRVYYERTNAQGLLERSSAIPVTVTIATVPSGNYQAASGASLRFQLTIPKISLTYGTDVRLGIYRTTVSPTTGALYYRVSGYDPTATGNNTYPNAYGTGTVTFYDNITDTALILREVDVVGASGELEAIPPQAPNYISTTQNRLVVSGGGVQPFSVQFSKLTQPGYGVAFNDALVYEIDRASGPVVATGTTNDVTFIFKEESVWAVDGEGPDNLGIGEFSRPRMIGLGVGCSSPYSVVQTPAGIMFKSHKGIYAVGQGLNYIGADVEGFRDLTTVSAEMIPGQDQVIFGHSDGVALVYDYKFNQWSTFTGHLMVGACATVDNYAFLATDGSFYVSNKEVYTDGGVSYPLRIVTNWLRMDKLQDFFRVRKLMLLGTYHSAHKLHVRVYNDYDQAPTETFSFIPKATSGSLMEDSTWGDDNWGDGAWGQSDAPGLGTVYQFEDRLSRQKTQSLRLEIYDSPKTLLTGESDYNRGYEIQAVSLEVGRKSGLNRTHEGRKV